MYMNDWAFVFSFNETETYSNYNMSFLQRKAPWASTSNNSYLLYITNWPTSCSLALHERRFWLMATCSVKTVSWIACYTALLTFPWAAFQIYFWRSLLENSKKEKKKSFVVFCHWTAHCTFLYSQREGKDKHTVIIQLWWNTLQIFIYLNLGHDRPQKQDPEKA